jgi:hypothetical protein
MRFFLYYLSGSFSSDHFIPNNAVKAKDRVAKEGESE